MKLNELLLPFDKIYPVGSYYDTSNPDFDPNTEWGGTWVREDDGTALVSYKSSGAFNKAIGTIVGEETHTLTIAETPNHEHDSIISSFGQTLYTGESVDNVSNQIGVRNNSGSNSSSFKEQLKTSATGGGQAHNNVQPSTIVYRWHRTS